MFLRLRSAMDLSFSSLCKCMSYLSIPRQLFPFQSVAFLIAPVHTARDVQSIRQCLSGLPTIKQLRAAMRSLLSSLFTLSTISIGSTECVREETVRLVFPSSKARVVQSEVIQMYLENAEIDYLFPHSTILN